ncbi:MAG TPA: hypothetical protein VMY37_09185 [Thermoguttaceae bacterium]|nr:hypothetical protein [Thermoguttaceae bacterium]
MSVSRWDAAATVVLVWCGLVSQGPMAMAAMPENLAPKAKASATSEHNELYLARFATDGKIPPAGSTAQDRGAAWCVLKSVSGDKADFSLAWDEPVDLAEIVYWGRTAWFTNECWKDYEVCLDDAAEPVARGTFQMIHGPQRIKIPKTRVRRVTLKFLNSYGGPNPGALEIQAFAESPSDREFTQFVRRLTSSLAGMPWVEENDGAAVRRLIWELTKAHGAGYGRSAEHLARLDQLEKAKEEAGGDPARLEDLAAELERLERDVLLFDVDKLLVIKRHEITATHVYTYHYEGFRPGGGLYVVSPRAPDYAPVELVSAPEGQILDCDLSYDGRTILFSWRRKQDEGYHLWTIHVDGTGLEQLTEGEWHDYNACWLPDGGIGFLSTRSPQFAYCWHAPVGVLCRMEPDGSGFRRLSANYLNDFTPAVLNDGRIIYSRWEYVDRPAIPIQSMWTINPDGTGLSVFFGNRVLSPGTFMEAQSIPGTSKVISTMTGHNGPTRGAIGVVDRSVGVNAQEAIENLTPDVPVPKVNEGNGNTSGTKQYSCPYPLDAERFLVSIRGPLLVRTISGECQAVALDAPDDGMQYLNARPIRPHRRPPVVPSSLPRPADESEQYATLFLQDVHNGLEPYVRRGDVTRIRVVREMPKTVRIDPSLRAFGFQFPVISCGATYAGKTVLGEVPVGPDGSVAFRVPARVPIYFMALDAEGRAVQRMRSFTHFMPGEVQGCVGCHEHRRQASRPNLAAAVSKPPLDLEPPEWGTGGFDYSRIVQPVLDEHCIKCHNPVDAPKGLDLTGGKTDFFNVSYDVLARENQGGRGSPYVSWIPTYNGQEWNILEVQPKAWGSHQSVLAEVVLSGHPDENGKPKVEMDEASRRRILAWIDLNVPYYGSSETAYPEMVGCRRIYPAELDKVLADVAGRRCAGCHQDGKIPRREWTRVTEPELNPFLVAPLAKSAGGSEQCGRPVFPSKDDPDYQAILAAFAQAQAMLAATPRIDMPGGQPSSSVSRSCQ